MKKIRILSIFLITLYLILQVTTLSYATDTEHWDAMNANSGDKTASCSVTTIVHSSPVSSGEIVIKIATNTQIDISTNINKDYVKKNILTIQEIKEIDENGKVSVTTMNVASASYEDLRQNYEALKTVEKQFENCVALDITIDKTMYENEEARVSTPNTYLSKQNVSAVDNDVTMSIAVPGEFNKNTQVVSSCSAQRIHDGVLTNLYAQYNETTGKIDVKSNRFSDFVLFYTVKDKEGGVTPSPTPTGTPSPTPTGTPKPTPTGTPSPTPKPTPTGTPKPTPTGTPKPTPTGTPKPTPTGTPKPTPTVTPKPTPKPTTTPTPKPTSTPTPYPTPKPTVTPRPTPTPKPTPTKAPKNEDATVYCTVTFLDWDGTQLASYYVVQGSQIEAPVLTSFTLNNMVFTFDTWNPSFTHIAKANAVYTAIYKGYEEKNIIGDEEEKKKIIEKIPKKTVDEETLTEFEKQVEPKVEDKEKKLSFHTKNVTKDESKTEDSTGKKTKNEETTTQTDKTLTVSDDKVNVQELKDNIDSVEDTLNNLHQDKEDDGISKGYYMIFAGCLLVLIILIMLIVMKERNKDEENKSKKKR